MQPFKKNTNGNKLRSERFRPAKMKRMHMTKMRSGVVPRSIRGKKISVKAFLLRINVKVHWRFEERRNCREMKSLSKNNMSMLKIRNEWPAVPVSQNSDHTLWKTSCL
ncbi:hypothetical protein CEXT_758431 [Caerostris extrusa]|uniref:Uncharacterized protein n=1 Tax=Caerostris extrusa TaxID=172846 RepID=A0AAV4N3Y1_CAEEX|nr:hypothetical protein CEXT_758431 [Caerostris extrusa]